MNKTKISLLAAAMLWCGHAFGAENTAIYGYLTSPAAGMYVVNTDGPRLLWEDSGYDARKSSPLTAGWVVDGKLCGYASDDAQACYVEYDWSTGEVLSSVDMPVADCPVIAALNANDGNIYGYRAEGNEYYFFTATAANPVATTVVSTGAITEMCLGLTYNPADDCLVGVNRKGTLLKVNPDGSQEAMMDTDYSVASDAVGTALTYSAAENCYYWNPTGTDAVGEMYVIDWATRYATQIIDFPSSHFRFLLTALPPEKPQAKNITLDISEAELVEGDVLTLTATVTPAAATDKTVTWSTSDASVATVRDGVVSALKAGEAVITAATVNGLTAECAVKVVEKEPEIILVTEIIISPATIEALPGAEVQLEVTVLPADATNTLLDWGSSDESVATVNQSGLVTIHSAGTAVISALATDGSGVKAECHVDGLTGIDALMVRGGRADVYDIHGILLHSGADINTLRTLTPGIYYIINIEGVHRKVVIR